MKLKKLLKVIESYQDIKVWGKDEEVPLYDGVVSDVPKKIRNLKIKYDDVLRDAPVEFRYDCCDCAPHYSVVVEEKN